MKDKILAIDNKPSEKHRLSIKKKWGKYKLNSRYNANSELIKRAFIKKPKSEEIKQNVSLIDYCYSTNLKDGFADMVKNICSVSKSFLKEISSKNIEDRIKLIKKIKTVNSTKNVKKDALSFATKYFFQYNQYFPIFDDKVKMMLYYLNKKYKFLEKEITKKELSDYENFYDVSKKFIEYFKLDTSYKNFDTYLWTWAKLINAKSGNEWKDWYKN